MDQTTEQSSQRLIVIANRSPLRRDDAADEWHPAVGGLATALLPVLDRRGGVWVSMQEDDAPMRQEYPEDDPRFDIRRVPMSDEELHNYYDGMANSILWPISHYMLQHLALERAFITDYRSINRRFASAVQEEYSTGDQIWVQDYHLMLLPGLLREHLPQASISHFWHIPWPAMEVFRIVPWSRELLRGMLGCDLIGFHVQEYVDNFIRCATVLLGAETTDHSIVWEGREIRVEAHPIGIDFAHFRQVAESEETRLAVQDLRAEVATEHLIVGIDRLDYTKGILERLLAFERFLRENPDYHERVTLYQIATPSRTRVGSYQDLKREVDEVVGRINGEFSRSNWVPVRYNYRRFSQEELCVFYRAADVCLTTPLRDGMNLVAQEFVAASEEGILVLSELAGSAYLLPEALMVNPYNEEAMAQTIREAIEMKIEERRRRLYALRPRVADLDVHVWADSFLDSLDAVESNDDSLAPPAKPRSETRKPRTAMTPRSS
jgi:trehalose 6-phosphate synthase/phosphatase